LWLVPNMRGDPILGAGPRKIGETMSKRFGIGALACCVALAGALVMAGGALAAFPGTNGKIAFVHDPGTAGSNTDIFAMDPTGQNQTPLTSTPDDDFFPSWSGDGEKIAFTRYPPGPPAPPARSGS
jgi:hypothetical protein